MNLLPKATSEFGKTDYWNSFFQKRGKKAFEWYGEYRELCGVLHKYIRPKDKILVIGCGNSTLSSDLYNVGYKQIMNIDVSGVVIKQMKARSKGMDGLEYERMDATNTTFQDGQFSVVLDKGTLDALMPDSSPETLQKIDKLFDEIDRVLSMLGRYVCVTLLQQHILRHLIDRLSGRGWMIRVCRCEDAERGSKESNGITLPVFVVVCTKLKNMPGRDPVLEVSQTEDVVQRMSGAEEMLANVKGVQDTALVCSGLNRCSIAGTGEVCVELTRPGDSFPRYTVMVAERPSASQRGPAAMTFAAFIVPQGREREWLFSTPEGRQVLVENSDFDRLAIIRLHREHKYESLQATQDETAETVLKLAPHHQGPGPRPKVPFLSVAADLGHVSEVARGHSQLSGDYVVEDAEGADKVMYRRLVFLLTQNVVQSEAKLIKVKENGSWKYVVDRDVLACEHHLYMTMGVGMVRTEDQPFEVLVIGLGGGALCTYLRNLYRQVKITAVDIDPEILSIATKYFDLKVDDQLEVVIEDGLEYLKRASAKGTKFNAVLFDVDSKDPSLGLSCPPGSFLDPEILAAVANCLTESGVFVLNFVCRVYEIRQRTWAKLSELFKDISSIKMEQEVNEIFLCWKDKASMTILDAADRFNATLKSRKMKKDDLLLKDDLMTMIKTF